MMAAADRIAALEKELRELRREDGDDRLGEGE
jgi:hypothetical protein